MIDKEDSKLTAFVLGELSDAEAAEVQQAIEASPELAAEVDAIREATGLLQLAFDQETKLELSDGQKAAVLSSASVAEVANVSGGETSSQEVETDPPAKRSSGRWMGIAIAASFAALIAGGAFCFYQSNQGEALHGGNEVAMALDTSSSTIIPENVELPSTIVLESAQRLSPGADVGDAESFEEENEEDGQRDGGGGFGGSDKSSGFLRDESLLFDDRVALSFPSEDNALRRSRLLPASEFTPERALGGDGNFGPGQPASSTRSLASGGRPAEFLRDREVPIEITESEPGEGRENAALSNIDAELTPGDNFDGEAANNVGDNKDRNGRIENGKEQTKERGRGPGKDGKREEAKPKKKQRSWKRVKAIPNTTRLMVGDRDELDTTGMQVNVQVDGFRARVLIDYFYYNDRDQQLEGNFKLRLPDDSSLYYFAFGESAYDLSPKGRLAPEEFGDDFVSLRSDKVAETRKGKWDNVKEARMVPREKAAHAFRETVRRRVDPALVEWSGAGVFNARVFPLAPKKLHRIVVGYDMNLTTTDEGLVYKLDLPEQAGDCQIKFNVREVEGFDIGIQPAIDPIDDGDWKQFSLDGKSLPKDGSIRLSVSGQKPTLLQTSNEEGDFWAAQIQPELKSEDIDGESRAVFMVDTSLSSSPEKFNVWLNLLEQTLNNNRDSMKEFAVLFFDIDSHFWKEGYTPNTPENVTAIRQKMETLALEGATNLYRAIDAVAEAKWITADSQKPDIFLLSDGAATWGETSLPLMERLLQGPKIGSLFAYQTGLTGTSVRSLRFLAGQTGGAVFSVTSDQEIASASTAHRKRPWRLKSVAGEGVTDVLTAGRVQWVYPGQQIMVVGRGQLDGSLQLEFEQSDGTQTVSVEPTKINSELGSRLYGQVSVGQLEGLGSEVFDVSTAYARHFRITGQTCSLLMLDSEEDYARFKIKPEEDLFVIKSKSASDIVTDARMKFSDSLADPKSRLLNWLKRLESMPGMSFTMPTALKLSIDGMNVEAVTSPLECKLNSRDGLSKDYLKALAQEQLDYDAIERETRNRDGSADEAVKVWSSLVERNPGDIEIARDVAFSTMELDRPAEAFYLLRRVAQQRPFQGNIYPAMGRCLADCGQADMAMIYYEVAMNGTFNRQGGQFRQIVAAEYSWLLRQVVAGKLESGAKEFAAARLASIGKELPFGSADLVVTMMWNQDQTDVDLHVTEPSGEECFYKNSKTRSDGRITSDITTGFGPEMYFNANAPKGKYRIEAKFFGNQQNRTKVRNRVYLTIFESLGTDDETLTRKVVQLQKVSEKEAVITIGVE